MCIQSFHKYDNSNSTKMYTFARHYMHIARNTYSNENGAEHGTACQNTVVTVREDKNGNITITGQEVPKGSPVTYAQAPEIVWGRQGVGTSLSPQSGSNRGSLYSWARWNSNDVNGTGDYIHLGYVASWEEFPEGSNSNVS